MSYVLIYLAMMVVAAALCGWHMGLTGRKNISDTDIMISCILILLPFLGIPFAMLGISITLGNKEARKYK